ncbi:MAG: sensor histidine kinase [Solirubrobacteraceae bacterium]
MESPGSYIRSAAQATFSAYRSLPIRWRLAGGSAALTFVILAGFAAIVGVLTTNQVRGQFDDGVSREAEKLGSQLLLIVRYNPDGTLSGEQCNPVVHLSELASAERDQIRIYAQNGILLCTQRDVVAGRIGSNAGPDFQAPHSNGPFEERGYRVEARELRVGSQPLGWLLYARPLSEVNQTLASVQFFLLLGVLGGSVLALLAGLAVAQRAMRPIVQLSEAAREIERTRDPSRQLPQPEADDEIAELARTLEGMLAALDAARNDTEAMLGRQREFVADASHELRTPLTSVLANLELLTEELEGEQADTAQAALRSTRRMRRLVGDLLLLARADAERVQPHSPTDLASVLVEVASELGPMADEHELSIAAKPAVVRGARDELHRLALNLIENAVHHTPPGTHIRASTATENGDALLVVQDDGPGITPGLEQRVFERFVHGSIAPEVRGRDGGRGSGLGLAIVRAVAESHGGTVALERPGIFATLGGTGRGLAGGGTLGGSRIAGAGGAGGGGGARFVIRIPSAHERAPGEDGAQGPLQTSTTTGSTIGRRRSRS